MNRQIKFRAWDKVTKKFLWPWPDGFYLFGETTCFDLIEQQVREYVPEGCDPMLRINDVEIMQFTGLHDSEGREVYEGDAVRLKNGDILTIKYSEIVPWFVFVENDGTEYLPSIEDYDNLKIIGNVFENPELVK